MSESAVIIALTLLAVLVGALVPVLVNAAKTLKSIRLFVEGSGPRLQRALDEFTEATMRINRIGATLQEQGDRLKPLVDSVAGVGETLHGLKGSLSTAGAVLRSLVPAFIAGLGATYLKRARSGKHAASDSEETSETEMSELEDEKPGMSTAGHVEPSEKSLHCAEEAQHGH
jgi:uncharacterized protein YoxC